MWLAFGLSADAAGFSCLCSAVTFPLCARACMAVLREKQIYANHEGWRVMRQVVCGMGAGWGNL